MPRGIRNVPIVATTKTIEPMEMPAGQDVPRAMKSTGPAEDALEPAVIRVVDRPLKELNQEKLANLKFMNDELTVHIHATSDPQAEQVFEVGNGGKRQLFARGETKKVQRKFVEVLFHAKTTTFLQKRKRGDDGVMYDEQVPQTSLRYPFSITHDPHPRGRDWAEFMMRSA